MTPTHGYSFGDQPKNDPKNTPRAAGEKKVPTLEEYVAAGYKSENYEKFVESLKHVHPSDDEPLL